MTQPRPGARVTAIAMLAAGLAACVREPDVARSYDGRVVVGRYVEPEAYADFLRGALAEASGDVPAALEAYREAARRDPASPEIWTRVGGVLCIQNVRGGDADAAFGRALALAPAHAGAWLAEAKCRMRRGDRPGARESAVQAAARDPQADGATLLLATTAGEGEREATRAMLVALTITASEKRVAWGALAEWTKAHGDVALWACALKEIARLSPGDRDQITAAAETLWGLGEKGAARAVAAAAAEADEEPLSSRYPLAARLAVDEAVARGDAAAVGLRCTRVRVPLAEGAARALLAGRWTVASNLAARVAGADPRACGARASLAVSQGGDVVGAASEPGRCDPLSAAEFVSFASALVHATSAEEARAVLARLAHEPLLAGDDLVVRPAVELVSRGALAVDQLPAEGLVELAVLRGEVTAGNATADFGGKPLDDRHRFLSLALSDSHSVEARELAATFAIFGHSDPIVAAASALMQPRSEGRDAPRVPQQLLARDASDPVLAATALRLAERAGDGDVARRARTALTALGEPRNVQ